MVTEMREREANEERRDGCDNDLYKYGRAAALLSNPAGKLFNPAGKLFNLLTITRTY